MLITAEMYAGEYKSAFNDCEQFIQNFYDSPYISYILYHKGRALFYLGEYEKAILVLSDYCHQYPEHEMYAAALFWIAESFYASYNYVESKSLYERILNEFPDDPKASAAQYRIETINQRSREEKLLYLLRETGEEYLSAKEAYERQLKLYSSETAEEIRKKLINLQERNKQLESKLSEYEQQLQFQNQEKLDMQKKYESVIKNLENDVKSIKENQNAEFIRQLKEKASQTQQLLDKKTQAE
jgi:tetratricopeptide (TPR) repeat protein